MRMKLFSALSVLALVALSSAEPGGPGPQDGAPNDADVTPPADPVETPIDTGTPAQDGDAEHEGTAADDLTETDDAADGEADQDAEQSLGDEIAYQRPAGLDDGVNGGQTDNGGADGLPEIDSNTEA